MPSISYIISCLLHRSLLCKTVSLLCLLQSVLPAQHSFGSQSEPQHSGLTNSVPCHRGTHTFAGYPIPIRGQDILSITNIGYVVGYCETKKNPLWVTYRVSPVAGLDNMRPGRPTKYFRSDPRTQAQALHRYYTNSGYNRAHLAPNYAIATRYGEQAQRETFIMSNVVPKTTTLNSGLWNTLERRIARNYGQNHDKVWVTVGPLFGDNPQEIKDTGVKIPESFYKIILTEDSGDIRVLAFIICQNLARGNNPIEYLTSVDNIEEATGLNFFSKLPDDKQRQIESQKAQSLW